jgi:hypothetical protein
MFEFCFIRFRSTIPAIELWSGRFIHILAIGLAGRSVPMSKASFGPFTIEPLNLLSTVNPSQLFFLP